jgi:hypothetical protein
MSGWTADELSLIGGAEELEIAARRTDGSLLGPVPIWVVRVGDELYVRSWRGPNGRWFRAVRASHAGHITADTLSASSASTLDRGRHARRAPRSHDP